jgi:hypothetical protein
MSRSGLHYCRTAVEHLGIRGPLFEPGALVALTLLTALNCSKDSPTNTDRVGPPSKVEIVAPPFVAVSCAGANVVRPKRSPSALASEAEHEDTEVARHEREDRPANEDESML